MHKNGDIYIQHTIAEPDYCEFLIEEVTNDVGDNVVGVNAGEEVNVEGGDNVVGENIEE